MSVAVRRGSEFEGVGRGRGRDGTGHQSDAARSPPWPHTLQYNLSLSPARPFIHSLTYSRAASPHTCQCPCLSRASCRSSNQPHDSADEDGGAAGVGGPLGDDDGHAGVGQS